MNWQKLQQQVVDRAIVEAPESAIRFALDGTVGNAQCFCWAALEAYEGTFEASLRPGAPIEFDGDPRRMAGRHHAAGHWFLIAALEAVDHAVQLEKLLARLGRPERLPPTDEKFRSRLRSARNLLAEHTEERLVFYRLTGEHTEHVRKVFGDLSIEVPLGGIDSYSPNNWGGIIDPMAVLDELRQLERRLAELHAEFAGTGTPPAPHLS
jgi:hypothetical protein